MGYRVTHISNHLSRLELLIKIIFKSYNIRYWQV